MYKFKYKKIAESLYDSFYQNPFHSTLWKEISSDKNIVRENLTKYMDYSINECEKYGMLYLPKEHVFGASIWFKPLDNERNTKKSQERKLFLSKYMGEKFLKKYKAVDKFMSEKLVRLIPEDCWYLSIIGLKSECRNKGLGEELMINVLKKADKVNASVYLETFTPRNLSFYKRFGFEALEPIWEPTIKEYYYIMIRQPKDLEL
jgi:ribosomal protein S18 acetylase RimI-like enzyme